MTSILSLSQMSCLLAKLKKVTIVTISFTAGTSGPTVIHTPKAFEIIFNFGANSNFINSFTLLILGTLKLSE
ncbi:hypothetical protein [Flavobacterium sp. XS2P39]|uniref:hypothetical protein n=1 Tax=Flavobacterium sp. XS2P39 TaxID=3401725 RepID=UPI003AAF8AAE